MPERQTATPLEEKIQTLLLEALILITAVEVLVGFQFRSVFDSGFDKLPVASQYIKMGGLGVLLGALALLLAPASYHRIVCEGEDTPDMHRVSSVMLAAALLLFALALGSEFYVAVDKIGGVAFGIVAGVAAVTAALGMWYGIELLQKSRQVRQKGQGMKQKPREPEKDEQAKLKDKIKHVLEEARMVIPGAQALMGFQFATMLMEGFDKLPQTSKYVHLGSLTLITISVILLMTPAAYHRIVEQGEETPHFHRFASRVLTLSMAPLALGIAGDVYVVIAKVLNSSEAGVSSALITALGFFGLWFGYTYYRRAQQSNDEPRTRIAARRSAE